MKNQSYLLEILEGLSQKDYILILVGDGSDKKKLKDYAKKLDVQDQVIFIGNVDNVHDYLNIFDVFLFPSFYEGLPLSLIEAQANGLPCIISNRITDEVIVSDLVTVMSIDNNHEQWINKITSSKRTKNSEKYVEIIRKSGYDVNEVGRQIQDIYLN